MSAVRTRLAVLEQQQRSALTAIVRQLGFPERTPQADLEFLLVVIGTDLRQKGLDVETAARPAWDAFLGATDATTRADALNWIRALRTPRRRGACREEEECAN